MRILILQRIVTTCVLLCYMTACTDSSEPIRKTNKTLDPITLSLVHPPELTSFLTSQIKKFQSTRTEDEAELTIELIAEPSVYAADNLASGTIKADAWISPSKGLIELANASVRNLGGKQIDCQELFSTPMVVAAPKALADSLVTKPQILISDVFPPSGTVARVNGKPVTYGQLPPTAAPSGYGALLQLAVSVSSSSDSYTLEDLASEKVLSRLGLMQQHASSYDKTSESLLSRAAEIPDDRYKLAFVTEQQMALYNLLQGKMAYVALYPERGSVWLDYTLCRNEREWVTDTKVKAIEAFSNYLMTQKAQEESVINGFRTQSVGAGFVPPLTEEYGVSADMPIKKLDQIDPKVIGKLIEQWPALKRPLSITLVIDSSGSMADERIGVVQGQLRDFLEALSPRDHVSLISVSREPERLVEFTDNKKEVITALNKIQGRGGFALYDAIKMAVENLVQYKALSSRKIILLIADGDDTDSSLNRTLVTQMVKNISPEHNVRLYAIVINDDQPELRGLDTVVRSFQGKMLKGNLQQLFGIFKEVESEL